MNLVEVLRLVIGIPLVLVLPGWMWSLAAFPRSRALGAQRAGPGELDVVERAAVSVGLSLALVSMGALLWNGALGLPMGTAGSLLLVALLTSAGLALWQWRLRRAGH